MLSLFDGISTGEALEEHCPGCSQHCQGCQYRGLNLFLKAWLGGEDEGRGWISMGRMRAGAPLLLGRAVEGEGWREALGMLLARFLLRQVLSCEGNWSDWVPSALEFCFLGSKPARRNGSKKMTRLLILKSCVTGPT